jgi:hypothetical protein
MKIVLIQLTPRALRNSIADRLQRTVLRRLRIEHPVVTDGYCQSSIVISPSNRTACTGMRSGMWITADNGRRRRRLAAQMKTVDAEIAHAR